MSTDALRRAAARFACAALATTAAQGAYVVAVYEPLRSPVTLTQDRSLVTGLESTLRSRLAESRARLDGQLGSHRRLVSQKLAGVKARLATLVPPNAAAAAAAAAAPSPAAPAAPAPPRILFVGDSMVSGIGSSVASAPALPRFLSRFVSARLDADVSWRAVGANGGDVAAVAVAFDLDDAAAATSERADVVVVVCGLNDWKTGSLPHVFGRELERLIARIRTRHGKDVRIVLPAMPVRWAVAFPEPLRSFLGRVNELYEARKRALAHGLDRVDYVSAPGLPACGMARFLGADGVHPNDLGSAVWAEHIAQAVLPGIIADRAGPPVLL